ncbi:lipid-A-disaccharide synthase [Catenovulum sp. SM1970]|nr:lipid-A-disaccharide synthase [Marinifaba aquimaris]
MSSKPLKIAIVAGEVSGDILGANLIQELKKLYPNASFEGIAGKGMLEQGCQSYFPMEELAVMGLVEVLGRLRRLLFIRKTLIQKWQASPPDIFIGIDAPDFNLTLERELKSVGIKTVHYVSPSIWAWRQKRVFKVKAATDLVLALLPFEKAFYDKFNVPCQFVGHTLADQIPLESSKTQARKQLGLTDTTTLGLFCGSRNAEVALLGPEYLKAAQQLVDKAQKQGKTLQVITAFVNEKRRAQLEAIKQDVAPDLKLHFFGDDSRVVMAASDVLIMASGTATLEAMLIKRPMVVGYKFKWLSYQIFKRMVKIAHFSLPNLLANRALVKELLQEQVTPENLVTEIEHLMFDKQDALIQTYTDLHLTLKKDAGKHASLAIANLIQNK